MANRKHSTEVSFCTEVDSQMARWEFRPVDSQSAKFTPKEAISTEKRGGFSLGQIMDSLSLFWGGEGAHLQHVKAPGLGFEPTPQQ